MKLIRQVMLETCDVAKKCIVVDRCAGKIAYATKKQAAGMIAYATKKTWLPLIMPQELQGGVPNAELDCVYPLAAEKTVI